MITFIAHLKVVPGNASALEDILTHVRDQVRAHEPGVAFYDFARSADDAQIYVVTEVYRDAAAHAHHMQTQWVRESLPRTIALIEGAPDIRQYVSPGTDPIARQTG